MTAIPVMSTGKETAHKQIMRIPTTASETSSFITSGGSIIKTSSDNKTSQPHVDDDDDQKDKSPLPSNRKLACIPAPQKIIRNGTANGFVRKPLVLPTSDVRTRSLLFQQKMAAAMNSNVKTKPDINAANSEHNSIKLLVKNHEQYQATIRKQAIQARIARQNIVRQNAQQRQIPMPTMGKINYFRRRTTPTNAMTVTPSYLQTTTTSPAYNSSLYNQQQQNNASRRYKPAYSTNIQSYTTSKPIYSSPMNGRYPVSKSIAQQSRLMQFSSSGNNNLYSSSLGGNVSKGKRSEKGLNIRSSSGYLSPNNQSFFAPRPSYRSSSSTTTTTSNNMRQNMNQRQQQNDRKKKTTFSEDVICWAFNAYLGCPKGKSCPWLHEKYDTSNGSGFDICWAFQAGRCRNKNCEWKHEMHPNKWKILQSERK